VPVAAASLRNFRLLMESGANRFEGARSVGTVYVRGTRHMQHIANARICDTCRCRAQQILIGEANRLPKGQKLNVACRSMRRFAAELEKGPPCSAFEISKYGEPRIPPGLARFTLLKTLRTFMLKIRL